MSRKSSFYRKIAYLCGIAVLIVPISLISAPAASRSEGGGTLSQLRRKHKLSQAQLGKIDPASASMSLATLGMRGVAANLLWSKAIDAKKKEDWDVLKATLNQITKLQPNFVSVWQFQSWNLSYNVSVEFDDFRHRYHWVKKGIDYLLEGTQYNESEPLLLWDAGWFFGHKMGRADEYKQFRRLFRDDPDFYETLPVDLNEVQGPEGKPDNWLCAREFFLDAQRAADRGARIKRLATYYWMENERVIQKKQTPLRGKNPLIFHSDPPKALINYADAISEEGHLGEVSKIAWQEALEEWKAYGDREIITSDGTKIHLNDLERAQSEVQAAEEGIEKLCGGIREQLFKERRAALPADQREALETPVRERTREQHDLAYAATKSLEINFEDIAKAAPDGVREEAMVLAERGIRNLMLVDWVERYREIVNFAYWQTRCEAEKEDTTIEARRELLAAIEAQEAAYLEPAKERYEQAWDLWAKVFEKYPILVDDVEGETVMESVVKYRMLLGQLDESFPPKGFKLMDLVMAYSDEYNLSDEIIAAESNSSTASPAASNEESPSSDTESTDSDASAASPADAGDAPVVGESQVTDANGDEMVSGPVVDDDSDTGESQAAAENASVESDPDSDQDAADGERATDEPAAPSGESEPSAADDAEVSSEPESESGSLETDETEVPETDEPSDTGSNSSSESQTDTDESAAPPSEEAADDDND